MDDAATGIGQESVPEESNVGNGSLKRGTSFLHRLYQRTSVLVRHQSQRIPNRPFERTKKINSADSLDVIRSEENTQLVAVPEMKDDPFVVDRETRCEIFFELSEGQKDLLKRTWKDDFEFLFNIGSDVYEHIFEKCPSAKTLFPMVAKYGENYTDSSEFKGQALKFVQVLAHAIQLLNRPESKLEPYLFQIGKAHCRFQPRGFEPDFWEIFQDAIEVAMTKQISFMSNLNEEEKLQAIEAWKLLALYIIRKMKLGYVEGIKKKDGRRSSQ